MKKTEVDINDLRSEYESSYLAYVPKGIKERGEQLSFNEWTKREKGLDFGEFDVAVFDSLDDSDAEVLHGSLPWEEALTLAQSLWTGGKHFGVEIIDCDENNMEPIVWIKSRN